MGVNKHLSETACPRFALLSAEAVPPKVYSRKKGVKGNKRFSEERLFMLSFSFFYEFLPRQ